MRDGCSGQKSAGRPEKRPVQFTITTSAPVIITLENRSSTITIYEVVDWMARPIWRMIDSIIQR